MKELSLHILDLVQNSIHANANEIRISIIEDIEKDLYQINISDNGMGMNNETLKNVLDPFFTTKNKKTGLGIPLLIQHAELTGGDTQIESELNKGTKVIANFIHSSIDRQPMGDITSTLSGLIRSYPQIEFEYKHVVNKSEFSLSTKELKEQLDGLPINSQEVIAFIRELIEGNLNEINAT